MHIGYEEQEVLSDLLEGKPIEPKSRKEVVLNRFRLRLDAHLRTRATRKTKEGA